VIERVRTDDGADRAATDFFQTMGGYLTGRPSQE
jgi:methionyl-tRNA formyltransferase